MTGEFRTVWRSLPYAERAALSRAVSRGRQGRSRRDAALMLWWAGDQLRRGPWTAMRVAAVTLGVVLAAQMLFSSVALTGPESLLGSPLLPVLLLVPFATWTVRRPRLQQAARLNASVLDPKRGDDDIPDPAEIERLLAKTVRDPWYRKLRAGA